MPSTDGETVDEKEKSFKKCTSEYWWGIGETCLSYKVNHRNIFCGHFKGELPKSELISGFSHFHRIPQLSAPHRCVGRFIVVVTVRLLLLS